MASYSGFWGGSGYALLYSRNSTAMRLRQLLRGKSQLDSIDQVADLITASGATQGSVTRDRVEAATGNALGGVRAIETETLTTLAASSTSNELNIAKTAKRWPSTYPADLSGNGGESY